ncbi:hypothetical protein OVA24_21240 [Luteolibacter sp. SL250]|uniref:hypothetical protein n=1 Tax=Luteolibacter sp. SL250 TaxID=2995170 RepID=UPI002270061E|nr:hypothetical protein [Luteolibacter sp. SL250]WAC19747.1 hypothetical protein OVA24_21240 [Luteolibacter sp. SL250]
MFLILSWFFAGQLQVLHAQPKPAADDPATGMWRVDDGRDLGINADGTATLRFPGKYVLRGKWEHDPFSERFRRYVIKWEIDQVFDFEMASDRSAIRGKKKDGTPFTASRLDALTIYVLADDMARVCLNGAPVVTATLPNVASGRAYAKKGDILTVELTNKRGDVAFALEAFRGNERTIEAGGFLYTIAAAPDWMTSPDLFGYRSPVLKTLKNHPIVNVREPRQAHPQAEDDGKAKKFYFKHVIR